MNEFDEECLNVFLENQSQLFEEAVAETLEDAEAFLGTVPDTGGFAVHQ